MRAIDVGGLGQNLTALSSPTTHAINARRWAALAQGVEMQKFDHGMRIVFENRIMSNVLFELMDGTKVWYTDMNSIQRGHANKLLAAQHSVHPTDGGHSHADNESRPATISG